MKLLYEGPLWAGSTSLQRMAAFRRIAALEVIGLDTGFEGAHRPSLWSRLRWRTRWPEDGLSENQRLVAAVEEHRPDVVFVDNSKVLRRSTLAKVRRLGATRLVFYTPDDIVAPHNLSRQLRRSFRDWDLFFTTKSFNVPELADLGVTRAELVGKAYAPELHRPLDRREVGPDFERFDLVFAGTYEAERCQSLSRLGEAGFSVVVYGSGWGGRRTHDRVTIRGPVYADDYTRALHHGRLALGFLRKINRDRVTQRSVEIPAMARPMLAERTDEHDTYFQNGKEYSGFSSDTELVEQAGLLLDDDELRRRIGEAGRRRCTESGYSTDHRASFMLSMIDGNPRGPRT